MLTNHRKEGKIDSSEKTELREHPESASMMVQQQHAKVERFLKLGYSYNDILRVLDSLHDDAQTNDILEELIKTCHTHTCPSSNKSLPNSPSLVPRGCSPSASQSRPTSERGSTSAFRPVVIDGSNVAMRWVHSLHLSVRLPILPGKLCIFISICSAGGSSYQYHFVSCTVQE